ncbi:AAA family ATPase [Caulobacter sp. UNC279MFTsu5.1]|uniref:AAA family ATPase n=1 Tax=Caulobacter sp. UNC279MFTsu5.1 TaxID=1502775 RepID=UPI00039B2D4F|nr:AAA family ATPase [Caulobacter sp. UNC279MFTsu5.1]
MTGLLKINRLSVHRNQNILYDEVFHSGVNIIHGSNGSGKSTIADFIYFALGGDLKEWRKEAALATYVLAEITAGKSIITIRRDVSDTGGRPMQIYFGSYDEAVSADMRTWETFPYRRPDNGYSFSQVLFNAIGIPEAISDGVSNITMHQLLRVLYSDQLTPIQRIFRVETFDTWQTRQAVGDLLCGLGGYDLYALQLFLREREKEYSEVSTRLRSLIAIASSHGDNVLGEQITAALLESNHRRATLQAQLDDLLERAEEAFSSAEADQLVKRQRKELATAKALVANLTDQIETLEFELTDADQFIDHLSLAIDEFDDAASTFFALGAVRFEFCPSCFSPLAATHEHSDKSCHLCGEARTEGEDESRALAVKLDLQMQIDESRSLQESREAELISLKSRLRSANTALRTALSASELGRRGASSKFENMLADVSRQIGFLDSQIAQLEQRQTLAQEIDRLTTEKARLNERIVEMKDKISATETAQQRRKAIAYTAISENLKDILDRDLHEHSDFGDIDSVTFDFADDWIAINGDKNRVGSASGMVVLKNGFLLSLFVTSLNDPKFNLPRFMLMDNIEDKGMVPERSWNFQRIILQESAAAKVDHQLIFSTSKIAPELAGSPYVVGGEYSQARHTLDVK